MDRNDFEACLRQLDNPAVQPNTIIVSAAAVNKTLELGYAIRAENQRLRRCIEQIAKTAANAHSLNGALPLIYDMCAECLGEDE